MRCFSPPVLFALGHGQQGNLSCGERTAEAYLFYKCGSWIVLKRGFCLPAWATRPTSQTVSTFSQAPLPPMAKRLLFGTPS